MHHCFNTTKSNAPYLQGHGHCRRLDALKGDVEGASQTAIEKYLVANFKVSDDKRLRRMRLRRALFQRVRAGAFVKTSADTFELAENLAITSVHF